MGDLPYDYEQSLFTQKNQALQIARAGSRTDPATIARLTSIATHWNDLKPGVALSLAQSGYDAYSPETKQVAQLATQQRALMRGWQQSLAKVGSLKDLKSQVPDESYQSLSPQMQHAVAHRAHQLADQQSGGGSFLGDVASHLPSTDVVGPLLHGDFKTAATNVLPGMAVASAARDVAAQQLDKVPAVGAPIKAAVRTTALAANTPLSIVQAAVREQAGGIRDIAQGNVLQGVGRYAGALGAPFGLSTPAEFEQTQAGQATKALSEGRPVDVGSGYLPSPESKTGLAAAEAARQAAPTIGGHAFTVGRAAAGAFGQATHLYEPDSEPFNIMSGIIDAGIAMKADPAAIALGAYGDAREARKVFAPDAGLIPTTGTNAVEQTTKADYLLGNKFTNGAGADITADSSPMSIKRKYPTLPVETVHGQQLLDELAKSKSIDETRNIISQATQVTGPLDPPGVSYKIRRATDMRLFATMPRGSIADAADKNVNVPILDDVMRAFNVPVAARDATLDAYIRDPIPLSALDHVTETLKQQLLAKGWDEAKASEFSTFFRDAKTRATAYAIDQSTGHEYAGVGVGIAGQGHVIPTPTLSTEELNSPIHLMDLRTARRMTGEFPHITGSRPWEVSQTALAAPAALWKPLQVLTARMMTRIFGETQLNLASRGMDNAFTHPLRFAALQIGMHPDSAVAQLLSRLPGMEPTYLRSPEMLEALGDEGKLFMNTSTAIYDPESVATKGYIEVPINHPDAHVGFAEQLAKMHGDPIMRGLVEADTPEAGKEWFWGTRERVIPGEPGAHIPTGEPTAENLPELFHGTSQRMSFPEGREGLLGPGGKATENLLGPGFYSTDNPDVAAKYMQKGRGVEPTVYSTKWIGDQAPHILDAEQGVTPDLARTINAWVDQLPDHLDYGTENMNRAKQALTNGEPLTTFIHHFRESLADGGMPIHGIDEWMDGLAVNLQAAGVDVLRYQGGAATGNQLHNAYVFLDPEKVSVSELGREAGTPTVVREGIEGSGGPLRIDKQKITRMQDEYMMQKAASDPTLHYDPIGDIVNDRAAADRYLDDRFFPRLRDYANTDELRDAVKTGKLGGVDISTVPDKDWERANVNQTAANRAREILDEGSGPQRAVVVRQRVPNTASEIQKGSQLLKFAVDKTFHALVDVPDHVLNRSPAFEQARWQKITDLLPYADTESRAAIEHLAENANLPDDVLARLKAMPVDLTDTPRLNVNQVGSLSKANALDQIRLIVHDLTTRSQFFDMTRMLVPFGDAFRLVAQRMVTLAAQEPQTLRRLQQGIQGAQGVGSSAISKLFGDPVPAGEGFFHKDAYGQDVFSMPGSTWLDNKLLGVPVPLNVNAKGLSFIGEGYPGLGGPTLTLPTKWFLPHTPAGDQIRQVIFPYGGGESQGTVTDLGQAFMPSYLQKIVDGPIDQRSYNNKVNMMLQTLASSGEYQLQGPEAQSETLRLMQDARQAAKWVYVIAGAAQFLTPGAPTPQGMVEDKTGRLAVTQVVAQKYHDQVKKNGPGAAFAWLVQNYGTKNFFVAQKATQATGYASPVTKEAQAWVDNHPGVRDKYPLTYGLFAPTKGTFDVTTYDEQFAKGERKSLTPAEQIAQAEQRLGFFQYDHLNQVILAQNNGGPLTNAQKTLLSAYKNKLKDEYPGFETFTASPYDTAKRRGQAIDEIQQAIDDPTIANTDAGAGVKDYLAMREAAITGAAKLGLASPFQANKAIGLRTLLRASADKIIAAHPDFRIVWDSVFSGELARDGTP